MTTDAPRTYKHQLNADDFVFAFTATEVEFAPRVDELRQRGVERLTKGQLRERLSEEEYESILHYGEGSYTCFIDVEIQALENEPTILVSNVQRSVPHLLLLRCLLPSLTFKSCKLIDSERHMSPIARIYVVDTTMGDLIILDASSMGDLRVQAKSMMGNFWISGKSTMGDFWIDTKSRTGNLGILEASTIGNLTLSKGGITGSLIMSGASITGRIVISEVGKMGTVMVLETSKIEGFSILGKSEMGSLNILDKSEIGDFRILGASKTENFKIENKSSTGDFLISGASTIGNFWILDGSTTGHFTISNGSTTNDFWINDKSTIGFFRVTESSRMGNFSIVNSYCAGFSGRDLYASFSLDSATIPQFRLTECYIPEMEIQSGCKLEAYFTNSVINLIDFWQVTLSKECVVLLSECHVYACLMNEFAMHGQLYMRQLRPLTEPFSWHDPSLHLKTATSTAMLTTLNHHQKNYQNHLDKLKGTDPEQLNIAEPTFRIVQSSLGKTEFTNCDLGGFRFEFSNSKITEVFMSGGTVPQSNIVIYGEQPDTLAWEEQKVSVYSQFKKIFDGQGDVYWATTLQAKTAEHQEKLLRLRKGAWFSTIFWDLWTFQLNRWSNLHGESWGLALVFTLGVGAIFYLLFLLSMDKLFQPTCIDWSLAG